MRVILWSLLFSVPAFAYLTPIGGGGGSGNATSIQSTPVSATPPTLNQLLQFNGTDWIPATVSGTGTVTTVNTDSTTSAILANTANVIGTGVVTLTLSTQTAHYGLFGPTSGSAAAPTFRLMVDADLPTTLTGHTLSGSTWSGTTATGQGNSKLLETDSSGNLTSATTITGAQLPTFTGDVTNSSAATTVAKIQGTVVSGTTGSGNVVFATGGTTSNMVVGTQSTADSSTKAASTAYVQANLASYLPLAGGTLTGGLIDANGYPLNSGVNSATTCTTSATINFASETAGPIVPVNLTTSDACVLAFSNTKPGEVWVLHINNVTGSSLTLPSSVDFGGASYSAGAPGTYDNIGLTVIDSTPHINGSVQGTGYAH